jgi:Uncharacterized protein involved in copper resistance
MIEICCGSYEDVYHASLSGAMQVELNSALHLGGLTPSLASLQLTKKNTNLTVICMVRPRGAGFCYSPLEFEQMKEDAKILLDHGADGIAFGCLTPDNEIDIAKTKEMRELISSYQKESVFHRAFDCVSDPIGSIEILIALGIDRVLTSGLQQTAMLGKKLLKRLQKEYGEKIQILAGSGINANNVAAFIEETGIINVHSSCKEWVLDPTTKGENVNYCYGPIGHENAYDRVSKDLVTKLMQVKK